MKKIAFTALFALALVAAGAQESKTSASTAGIFGNDVDDYMDVNDWAGVNPEKLFGFLGVETDMQGEGAYDIGFAKKFGSAYWGTYFAGDIGDYTAKSTETDDGTTKVTNSAQSDITAWQFDNILGVGALGIKFGFKYFDNDSSTTKPASGASTETKNKAWQISGEAGFAKDKLTPHFGLAFAYNFDDKAFCERDWTKVSRGSKITTDNKSTNTTINSFKLFGGTGIDLSKNEQTSHVVDLDATLSFAIPGDDKENESVRCFELLPYYTVKYNASEKLALGAKFGLPLDVGFGDKTIFGFAPKVSGALTYKLKEKFTVNAGIELGIISFSYISEKNANDKKESTSQFNSDDGKVTFTTGFNYAFTETVNFDFNWNIIAGIFGEDFETDFNTDKTADGFWGNMNLIFQSQIGFIVIVKL